MTKKLIHIASILLLVSGFCAAAVPIDLNDFNGTSWVVYGSTRASISRLGSGSSAGVGYLTFNGDGTLQIKDDADFVMSGSYYSDSKGKLVIDVDEQNIEKFFNDYLQQALDNANVSVDSLLVDVPVSKTTTKVTYIGDIVSLATTISAKAKIHVVVYGKTYNLSMSFTIKLTGDHPVWGADWASKWLVNSKVSLSTKKVKVSKQLPFELTIGNFGASGLGINECKLVDVNAVVLSSDVQGEFIRTKNKMIIGSTDGSVIENLITTLINENPNVASVYLNDYYPIMTGTVKDGKSITLGMSCSFWVDISYKDGTSANNVKGTLKLSGKGVPAQ